MPFKVEILSKEIRQRRDKFSLRHRFRFSSFYSLRNSETFSSMIVEWMLSLRLCPRNEGQWLEVIPFFQFTLQTTAWTLIIIKSLTNQGSAPQTIQFLSSSFSRSFP